MFSNYFWMASASPSLTNFPSSFQMAFVSPFPLPSNITSPSVNFRALYCPIIFHLRVTNGKTRQSNSSGLRRLNGGSCCTPKFSLSLVKYLLTRSSTTSSLQHWCINLGLKLAQGQNGQLHTEKSNFDFLVNITFQRSNFIKTFKNIKLNHQEVKKVKSQLEKSRFPRLRNFLSVFIHDNFITSCHSFTKMQDGSRETFNMKVVDLHDIYNIALHNFS